MANGHVFWAVTRGGISPRAKPVRLENQTHTRLPPGSSLFRRELAVQTIYVPECTGKYEHVFPSVLCIG